MAVGDLLVQDYQYEFNGVVLGAGTPFTVEKVSGLLGQAQRRVKDIDLENAHGSIPGQILYSPRIIAMDIRASTQFSGQTVGDLLDLLSRAFDSPPLRTSTTPDQFVIRRPSRTNRFFYARGTKLDIDSDFNAARGLITASAEILCSDPLCYELALSTQTVSHDIGVASGGMVVAISPGIIRDGIAPIVYINGACTNPRITNYADNSRQLKLDVVLAANQICRVNMKTFEVAIQTGGGSNPWVESYSIVRDDSQFWKLMPGNNAIIYVRTGSAAASSVKVDWNNTWARG